MRVCANCGHKNRDDAQFCEACQDYLWADREESEGKQSIAVATSAADTAGDAKADERAEEASGRDAPGPRHPADEPEPRPPEPPDFDEPEPGELICDQCGKGNRAEANFCRRCGASLAKARVAAHPPWWRRLFGRTRRTHAAGERRRGSKAVAKTGVQKARHGAFQVLRVLGILALLGVVSVAAVRGDVVDRVGEEAHDLRVILFPKYEPVDVAKANATSRLPGRGAIRAFDGNVVTYWAEGVPGDGHGQKLVAHFGREADIARVGVTLGNKDKPTSFKNLRVPHTLRLGLFDRHGAPIARKVLYLDQTPDFQRFSIDASNATRAVLTILQAYPSRARHATSITEVEFFEKQ